MPPFRIEPLASSASVCTALSEILIEVVAHGGSVSFMYPLSREAALTFWESSLAAADRGERIVLGAFDAEVLIGTVTLQLDLPPNQPHRAEIAKMMTRLGHRHRGAATALLRAAEALAIDRGRTLLVLDTASGEAERLYVRGGWQRAGVVPDYAMWPGGGFCDTVFFWKKL